MVLFLWCFLVGRWFRKGKTGMFQVDACFLLVGMSHPVNILQLGSDVDTIQSLATITAVEAALEKFRLNVSTNDAFEVRSSASETTPERIRSSSSRTMAAARTTVSLRD